MAAAPRRVFRALIPLVVFLVCVLAQAGCTCSPDRPTNPLNYVDPSGFDAADVIPHGSTEARRGLSVGQIFGGIVTLVGGLTGEVVGGIATTTGIGAALGVPAIAVSTGLVVGGLGNIGAGIRGLLTTGSGSGAASEGVKAPEFKVTKPGISGKEGAKDVPSWVRGQRPQVGESGRDFARRVLDEKYGSGNWKEGAGSEFNKIRKWGDRAFQDPSSG